MIEGSKVASGEWRVAGNSRRVRRHKFKDQGLEFKKNLRLLELPLPSILSLQLGTRRFCQGVRRNRQARKAGHGTRVTMTALATRH